MAAYGPACYTCGSRDCPGCEDGRAECADCGAECSADWGFCSRACEEHYEKREANLQRWNLRPEGKEIVVKGGPA